MILSRNSPSGNFVPTFERSSSHLRIVNSDTTTSYNPVPEIKKLVEELVKIVGLKRVKAIATSFPDIHWIDFQIELEGDIELSDETWDKIQDMVIDCEWKLIDDSAEEWYFRPQIVDRFYLLRDEVIADSDEKTHTEVGRLKISSSNSPKFVVLN
jgi:hypothetical protein